MHNIIKSGGIMMNGEIKYKRVPLKVKAVFSEDGKILPNTIYFGNCSYHIMRIIDIRRHCPHEVGSIAPTEYTVLVDNVEKKIYYEPATGKWFSVKDSSLE